MTCLVMIINDRVFSMAKAYSIFMPLVDSWHSFSDGFPVNATGFSHGGIDKVVTLGDFAGYGRTVSWPVLTLTCYFFSL